MTTMNGGSDDKNDNNDHKQQPQIDDAKNFLERVKETFKNSKGVYDRFVEIMKNFKHDRLNTGGVIKEVQDLFAGHDDLFLGFQNFLPAAGLVTQDELREIQQNINTSNRNGHDTNINPDFNMAVTFICKIKQRFGSHRRIYQEFLQILQHFQTAAQANDTSVIKNVKSRIRALFRDHPDLLDQFDYFLPPLTAHFSRQQTLTTISSNSNNMNGRVRKRGRDDSDGLDGQPDSKRRRQDNKKKSIKNNDEYTRERIQTRSRSKKIRNRCKKNTRRDSTMASTTATATATATATVGDSDIDDDEITFSDNDISDTAGDIVEENNNNNSYTSRENIRNNSHNTNNTSGRDRDDIGGDSDEHKGLRIFSKLRKDIPDHLYKHVLTLTQLYPMGLTEFSVVGKLICDALREHGHTELMKEFERELSCSKQSWFFRSRGQNYYEYLTNNILLKSCKAVQSSYRQLPQDVIQPRCSGRHPDAANVLNDYFVSKPTGGENQPNGEAVNSAGGRLKNIYNENLQKSEDDLFELDMMIATNDAARKRLEQLYKTVMQPKSLKHINSGNNKSIDIPPVEKRAISRLYSEHGNKVLNLLKKMPETTIPVVLKRLREKSNEWQQLKNEMKIVWKSVAQKNYFKAHDFRYTMFKQYDTKRITLKNICKQIEERHEQNSNNSNNNNNNNNIMDSDDTDDNLYDNKLNIAYDKLHNSRNRKINYTGLDFNETWIASTNSGSVCINGNGVMSGVGLIGNASHDYIIQQMSAGLNTELGDYCCSGSDNKVLNNYDYRFVICKQDILRDCARFIFQHANKKEVGEEKKEKKLFAEILESIFKEFFKMDISEQSIEFLQNDIDDSDNEQDEFDECDNKTDTSTTNNNSNTNTNNNNNNINTPPSKSITMLSNSLSNNNSISTSPDPISKIMRNINTFDENVLTNISIDMNNELINKYITKYYSDDVNNNSLLIFGNKTIYALFRYLHFLYSRMNFAYKLCRSENPLYGVVETNEETQRKYKDFLSHLSKLINGQIEEETFEDECRKLLGIKSYQLFTINKVIHSVYLRICDFDTDEKLHQFYKLFLSMKKKNINQQNRIKYYIAATQISNKYNKPDELYQIEYFNNKILGISLCDKYQQNNNNNSNNNNNNHIDIKMSDNNNSYAK